MGKEKKKNEVNNIKESKKEKKSKEEKKKIKEEKKLEKQKNKKEKEPNKIIESLKVKWLRDGTKMFLIVSIIIMLFILITLVINDVTIAPLDFTQEKLYTLTDASKEKVRDIQKEVKLYFVGTNEENPNLTLAKQYNNVNSKIVAEAVNADNRPDLVQKYGIDREMQAIIVECGEKSKILTPNELVTYDTQTYETISIAEEKLTSSIQSVTTEDVPKVYFLEGYSEFSLKSNLTFLGVFLSNEINKIDTLDIMTVGKIPDDCDTLVINTPSKDFDETTTNSILNYIQSGRNILWLNASTAAKVDMPNVNKILANYGVNPFEQGVIEQTNTNKMVVGAPTLILPEVQSTEITKDIYNAEGTVLLNATKINVAEDKLEELKVIKEDLMTTGEECYFITDFKNPDANRKEKSDYLVGAKFEKTIKEANEQEGKKAVISKLVLYGENLFISDARLNRDFPESMINLRGNKDLMLNSIAYLVDRPEDISARKSTGVVTYTPTESQDIIVRTIIFAVPILIILTGIIVWQVRRRKGGKINNTNKDKTKISKNEKTKKIKNKNKE